MPNANSMQVGVVGEGRSVAKSVNDGIKQQYLMDKTKESARAFDQVCEAAKLGQKSIFSDEELSLLTQVAENRKNAQTHTVTLNAEELNTMTEQIKREYGNQAKFMVIDSISSLTPEKLAEMDKNYDSDGWKRELAETLAERRVYRELIDRIAEGFPINKSLLPPSYQSDEPVRTIPFRLMTNNEQGEGSPSAVRVEVRPSIHHPEKMMFELYGVRPEEVPSIIVQTTDWDGEVIAHMMTEGAPANELLDEYNDDKPLQDDKPKYKYNRHTGGMTMQGNKWYDVKSHRGKSKGGKRKR